VGGGEQERSCLRAYLRKGHAQQQLRGKGTMKRSLLRNLGEKERNNPLHTRHRKRKKRAAIRRGAVDSRVRRGGGSETKRRARSVYGNPN